MRASELKAGEWFETTTRSGKWRGLCVEPSDEYGDVMAYLRGYGFEIQRMNEEDVTPLPFCDSWDWQPVPEPSPQPEAVQVREGRFYKRRDGKIVGPAEIIPGRSDAMTFKFPEDLVFYLDGTCPGAAECDLIAEVPEPPAEPDTAPLMVTPDIIEPEPRRTSPVEPVRYRPFASAEEFKPHRDRWIRLRNNAGCWRPTAYTDQSVFFKSEGGQTYEALIECRFDDDGQPCGVATEAKESEAGR